jgi:50S ribosomal protein L16 3-hydroxylase
MEIPPSLLGGLSPADFLEKYWQKKPLLVRGALPGFVAPFTPVELAGLACEEDVTSRIIMEKGGDYPWQVRYGPFSEDIECLPPTHWTLLVQEVDRFVPEVAALLDHFRFIPNWRIDDVMVSYAPEAGGVGAHVDNYDVFLLQAYGRRRWQINYEPVVEEELIEDIDVRILSNFKAQEDWILEPGDLLYLPPRIAHYGIALDDCMTFSIGFRAPSHADILTEYVAYAAERVDPLARYSDPELRPQLHPGEIGPAALKKVQAVLEKALTDEEAIARWFGTFMTEPRRGHYAIPLDDPYEPAGLLQELHGTARLRRSSLARFAFIRLNDGAAILFAGGTEYPLPYDLSFAAPLISGTEPLTTATLQPHLKNAAFLELLTELVNEGYLELT